MLSANRLALLSPLELYVHVADTCVVVDGKCACGFQDCTFCRKLGWCDRSKEEKKFQQLTTRGTKDDVTNFALFSRQGLAQV